MHRKDMFGLWGSLTLKIEVKLPFIAGKDSPAAVGVLQAVEML